MISGLLLFATGMVYLLEPDVFRRGIFKDATLLQKRLGPRAYRITMRALGALVAALGLVRVFRA